MIAAENHSSIENLVGNEEKWRNLLATTVISLGGSYTLKVIKKEAKAPRPHELLLPLLQLHDPCCLLLSTKPQIIRLIQTVGEVIGAIELNCQSFREITKNMIDSQPLHEAIFKPCHPTIQIK